ncbi:thiamine-phosphate kinase [Methanoplanus sp. FWC-SCC4]|uniref:Thiamine-monophosphate kinase n=1 Tax=Methanochimaera problematica TaxID=2609417 RepID=A0AA97FBL2_9EURY|nr:thiamine-phosphate kinase [Methanoplanus sp. FWC-SCC4]
MDDRELVKMIGGIIGTDTVEDDCAKIPFGDDYIILSTDMLHETTDFPTGMTDWQIGWMSAAVTISDIASDGAVPLGLLLAAGLDRPERLKGIMQGAKACCDEYGASLIGGDVDAHSELTIVTTGIGRVEKENYTGRKGALPGDLVCIVGDPGYAQAALDGDARYRDYLLIPKPFVYEGRELSKAGVSSMMDVSDGLALSLYDLADLNGVGFEIDSGKLPKTLPQDYVLYGGGDFGLLFTCEESILRSLEVGATVIGRVISDAGVFVDGKTVERRGYVHKWD